MPICHYAMKREGFLILGNSECVLGEAANLFEMIDRSHKIYVRKSTSTRVHYDFAISQHAFEAGNTASAKETSREGAGGSGLYELQREADHIILTKYAPVTVVINADMEILQSRGRVGLY